MRAIWLRRWILAIAQMVLALRALPSGAAPIEGFAGHWEAIARKDGRSWRFTIDVIDAMPRTATVDLTDVAAYGVEFNATFGKAAIHLERKTAAATTVIEGTLVARRIIGRLLFSGIEAPFTAERRETGPPPLAEEDVVFENGGVTLTGTLVHPTGAGPYPAIVCTHGSGPGDRQFAGYRSEGVFYARLGLAALIYDRRGSGKSTGDASTSSMQDLADDALAGVRLLKSKPDVQGDRIGVSGISQGGWIAPLAASRSSDVAFVIVTSAAGINPMDQSIFDVENALRRGGFDASVVSEATALRKRVYEFARTGTADSGLAAALEAAHDRPWYRASALPYPLTVTSVSPGERKFLMFEPAPVWRKVTVPVLALWGGEDKSVPTSKSRAIIEEALVSAGNRDHTLVLYPAADHGLRLVRDPAAAWDFPRVVPGARALVAEWLHEHFGDRNRPGIGGPEWMPS